MSTHLGHLMRLLNFATEQTMTKALEEMELTAAQGHVMAYITHCSQPPCPRDVEEKFHLSHATVSGILSRLEKKGFLAFQPDEKDRRCKRIYVLEKGRSCHDVMHQTILNIEGQLVQDFSPEEQAQFQALLLRAIANMGITPCHLSSKEESKP